MGQSTTQERPDSGTDADPAQSPPSGSAVDCSRNIPLTELNDGAVYFPQDRASLGIPFPENYRISIAAGYGPAAGSRLHSGIERTSKGNDFYALDLYYTDFPDAGRGLPVLAALEGVVALAGWATEGWSNFGQRIVLKHTLGDGQLYHSIYAHLESIDTAITEGATVKKGQLLGELGRSCQGQLECASFQLPHLHFSIHQNSSVGGSGTGGSYAGKAVLPEPIDGYGLLAQGQVLLAKTPPNNCSRQDCTAPDPCTLDPKLAPCLEEPTEGDTSCKGFEHNE